MQLMVMGLLLSAVAVVVYAIFDFFRKASSKQGRKEIRQEVGSTVKFIATDQGFHKELAREFRPTLIIFGVLGVVFLLAALGVDV